MILTLVDNTKINVNTVFESIRYNVDGSKNKQYSFSIKDKLSLDQLLEKFTLDNINGMELKIPSETLPIIYTFDTQNNTYEITPNININDYDTNRQVNVSEYVKENS